MARQLGLAAPFLCNGGGPQHIHNTKRTLIELKIIYSAPGREGLSINRWTTLLGMYSWGCNHHQRHIYSINTESATCQPAEVSYFGSLFCCFVCLLWVSAAYVTVPANFLFSCCVLTIENFSLGRVDELLLSSEDWGAAFHTLSWQRRATFAQRAA